MKIQCFESGVFLYIYFFICYWLLGASAKLRKATFSFVMPVRPSAWKNSATNVRIFIKFYVWVFIRKSVRKPKLH
jgi:hypothetical protein